MTTMGFEISAQVENQFYLRHCWSPVSRGDSSRNKAGKHRDLLEFEMHLSDAALVQQLRVVDRTRASD